MAKYLDETGLGILWQKIKDKLAGKRDSTATVTQAGAVQSHTLADNTEYQLTGVSALSLSYPNGNFDCWITLSVVEGATVSFPAGTRYIGGTPSFAAGGCYEISVKNGVVVAGKVGGVT